MNYPNILKNILRLKTPPGVAQALATPKMQLKLKTNQSNTLSQQKIDIGTYHQEETL